MYVRLERSWLCSVPTFSLKNGTGTIFPNAVYIRTMAPRNKKKMFTLTVDDFGIKYFTKLDLDHLLSVLRQHYTISVDPTESHCCGLIIKWNYAEEYVDIYIPGCVSKPPRKLRHPRPNNPSMCHTLGFRPRMARK